MDFTFAPSVGTIACLFLLFLVINHTVAAEYQIDVTVFDASPLVGTSSSEQIRTYLPWNRRGAKFIEIGRSGYTGTGNVGNGYDPSDPEEDGSGLPSPTSSFIRSSNDKWRRLEVNFPLSTSVERIGVFYVTTEWKSNRVTIPTIKISEEASITPNVYTKTIGIGESVTLSVSPAVGGSFRWVHNAGNVITYWNDQTEVTIDNIRLADAGIYECYKEDRRDEGKHAIMRLIVRACPSPKYGADCSANCRTCWNGGICSDDDGTCLCQPGFYGDECEARGGSNTWGAQGSLFCSSGSGNCRTALICGPDPIGCSCVAGYHGLNCTLPCSPGWYGSNCNRQCHCNISICDSAIGCKGEAEDCHEGYDEEFCQGVTVCNMGYFGKQCEFLCHCNGGGECDKDTGVCNSGQCAEGWGGTDCQQVLPYFDGGGHLDSEVQSVTVHISWNEWNQSKDYGTGPIDHYRIYYGMSEPTHSSEFQVKSNDSMKIISDLSPESKYRFAVAAVKFVDGKFLEGQRSNNVYATTGCAAPTRSPTITSVVRVANDEAKISWTIPSGLDWLLCSTGLHGFVITHVANRSTETILRADKDTRKLDVTSLSPCTNYTFTIGATNKDAQGIESSPKEINTFVAPEIVEDLKHQNNLLLWNKPSSTCEVTEYVIAVFLTNIDQCEETNTSTIGKTVNYTNTTLTELAKFSTYQVMVRARSGDATGQPNEITFTTEQAVPSGMPQDVKSSSPEEGLLRFTWQLPACGQRHGQIILFEYEFGLESESDEIETENTTLYDVTFSDLSYNKSYLFRVRAYTSKGFGPFSDFQTAYASGTLPGSSAPIIIGCVFSVLIVSLVVGGVIIVYLRRKRNINSEKRAEDVADTDKNAGPSKTNVGYSKDIDVNIQPNSSVDKGHDKPVPKPTALVKPVHEGQISLSRDQSIEVDHLLEYVEIKKAGGPDHELKEDYQALPGEQLHSWTVAKKPENQTKNRYKNIITYDHSRVVLEIHEGDPHSDYINASYIDGYQKEKAYIAAQGPNAKTVDDMWRMIWQENCRTIIMVTSLVEGGKIKCEKYWPDNGKASSYGDYTVTNAKEDEQGVYIVREFAVLKTEIYANQQSEENDSRKIQQLHYTGWPDMGVPELAEPVLKFLDHANACNPHDAGPILVHCSAGVGRTGTFITLDAMLKMAKSEGKVDVFNFVYEMRNRRTNMIQTEVQYFFVHDALLEALFCGKTTISTSEFEQVWKAVDAAMNGEDNHILGQFKALSSMYPALSEKQSAGGRSSENKEKNRFNDCVPPDSARPKLFTQGDGNSNDYISAAFCHGHVEKNLYLTTQVPLPNTVADFWRLMCDYQCHTIVTLNDPSDTNETYGIYWPDEGTLTCGQFTVEFLEVEKTANTVERKLRFHMANRKDDLMMITLLQYTDWPSKSNLPPSTISFVKLLDRVDMSRRDCDNQRVVVVDEDGVSRCGIFCAVTSIIDQIKEQQEVDVFRAVKRLKVCRHDMIKTMDQYTFCYDAARVYLQSFETYANFM